MSEIKSRLHALRKVMEQNDIDAYIIPSSDQHLSEYVPECWKAREWISGFNGSAGTVVVTREEAGLWTDSRYFLQAAQQLEGTTIELRKMGLPETPSITDYLRTKQEVKRVGFADRSMSLLEARKYEEALSVAGKEVVSDLNLIAEVWSDAPEVPKNEFFEQPLKYAGESTKDKVARVREKLAAAGANTQIITMLDEVAWLFNIRGNDVAYNPVGIAYGLVTSDMLLLYTFKEKLPLEVKSHLGANGVVIRPYEEIYNDVAELPSDAIVLVDPARTNFALYQAIPETYFRVEQLSPITLLKAVKNEAEYQGYRSVMRRDGAALTRFFIWLEQSLAKGEHPTEYEVGVKLSAFRAADEQYVSDSFGTIAGYRGHGAIVHYSATPESSYELEPEGLFLLDSGGQYHDGTTDITRTVSLGKHPTSEQKEDYTRVLKGHIRLAMAVFPEGTCGVHLDLLAKQALWSVGKNYGHGTGHGIGHFLNVHEGPQNIRTDLNPTPIMVGMVTSNEPGFYLEGQYGIRIENLIRTVPHSETDFGKFFRFETLTLCYMDSKLVDVALLTDEELEWYNQYQTRVYDEVSPLLNADEAVWLKEKTAPLSR
ncbi:MAG: aminopeptidase P family protein [Porphyromonas sp.]|nr:aminopeptidase P family protein [Porphyromonas sp.]